MSSSSSSNQGILQRGDIIAGCGGESATAEQFSRWKVIYPNYIDSSKSTKQGRRLTVNRAVEQPLVGEMIEILHRYNVPFVLENKAYSRDWLVRGRLRVNLSSVSDESVNTKTKLMQCMASEIPSLKSREQRLAKESEEMASLEKKKEKEARKATKGKKK